MTHETIKDAPVTVTDADSAKGIVALPAATTVLGYMRRADIAAFVQGKFFYCRATDDQGAPLTLDISAAQGALIIGWCGPQPGPFHTTNWMARIASCRLVSGQTVKNECGVDPSSGAVHYLLFKLEDISPFEPRDVTELVLKANLIGKGGRFRAFQIQFKQVMQRPIVRP